MSTSTATSTATDTATSTAHVGVAEQVVRLVRTLKQHHAQMVADPDGNVEWNVQILLRCLAGAGPLRMGEAAERLHADPSTVSRQVAALVKDGLLERRADPEDGRASLLVLTPKAYDTLREFDAKRDEHFARMLDHWSESELRTFAGLLTRFTDDFEAAIRPESRS